MSDTAGSRSDSVVDQLLLEADMDDDGRLRPALLELRALADTAPEPSAAIAALMVPAGGAAGPVASAPAGTDSAALDVPRVDELAARRRAKRRVALTTFSVAVALSAGGAVAAASDQGIRDSFKQLNHAVTSFVTGSGVAPAGHQAEEPAAPAPTVPAVTAPAVAPPGGPASIPAVPAPATQPAAPPSNAPGAPETAAAQPTSPGKPGEVPAPETLPGAVPEHIAKGLGKSPEVPVPSQVPLPGTLPAVPLP